MKQNNPDFTRMIAVKIFSIYPQNTRATSNIEGACVFEDKLVKKTLLNSVFTEINFTCWCIQVLRLMHLKVCEIQRQLESVQMRVWKDSFLY